VNASTSPQIDYLCPGQEHPISRSLHLARLAEFYPACRCCAHRKDADGFSAKLVERLHEVWSDGHQPTGFCGEGFWGNSPNELHPNIARHVASAFGLWLYRERGRACRIAIANDARTIMPEYVAAVCEGLRFAACEACDIGPATSAAIKFAITHFELDGGILLGGAGQNQSAICLKLWALGPHRMLENKFFHALEATLKSGLDRPARAFGSLHRLQAETPYLAALAEQVHGLRPLRFVVDSSSRPWTSHLEKLLQTTACRIIPCRVLSHEFPQQIFAYNAHFGVKVTNDGESCTFFDEQGHQFEADTRFDALPRNALPLGEDTRSEALPRNALSRRLCLPEDRTNIEVDSLPSSIDHFEAEHLQHDVPRQSMGMRTNTSTVVPIDALTTVVRLLQLLSRDDRPCSAALDDAS
jgi:phosphomannomutase